MKSTGMVRRVDKLGRVVIPIELRRTMNIEIKDELELFVDGGSIILQKYLPACVFCGNANDIAVFHSLNVCKKCRAEIAAK